jgi:4-hydroxy-4-methyl-2-oxoglutarate aldolase
MARAVDMESNDKGLLSILEEISVCQLADGFGPSFPVETEIRPLDPSFRICGPARTVRCEPGENLSLHHALHLAKPGEVLVAAGSMNCGLWGELMSTSARHKGLKGTIIDGGARDPIEIGELDYPVFSRCLNPRKATKDRYGEIDVPIRVGCLVVNPGDIIVADANGILAFPADRLVEVVRMGTEVRDKETEVKKQILGGKTIFEISGFGRLIPHPNVP